MSEGPELSALADALRALAPAPAALDRDELLFRAGRSSAPRPRRWPWALATALASVTALGLGGALLFRPPATHTVERVVHVTVVREARAPAPPEPAPPQPETAPAPLESSPTLGPGRYRQMEDQLLRWGLDGVGMPPPERPLPGRPLTVESLAQPF